MRWFEAVCFEVELKARGLRSFRYKEIRYKLKSCRDIIEDDSIHVDSRWDAIFRPVAGGEAGGLEPHRPTHFHIWIKLHYRIEILLTKLDSCQWKLQFPSIADPSKTMYCYVLCKGTKSYFCSAKYDRQLKKICLFFMKIDRSQMDRNAPMTIPEPELLGFFGLQDVRQCKIYHCARVKLMIFRLYIESLTMSSQEQPKKKSKRGDGLFCLHSEGTCVEVMYFVPVCTSAYHMEKTQDL